MSAEPGPVALLLSLVGRELGVSAWHTVSQEDIDAFARVTGDHQWIHTDPARAATSPFGGTVAHGFLTLSLLSVMAKEAVPQASARRMGVNYGLDRVRFVAPVPAGARLRGRFTLAECTERGPAEVRLRYAVAVEVENGTRPALLADWIVLAAF